MDSKSDDQSTAYHSNEAQELIRHAQSAAFTSASDSLATMAIAHALVGILEELSAIRHVLSVRRQISFVTDKK